MRSNSSFDCFIEVHLQQFHTSALQKIKAQQHTTNANTHLTPLQFLHQHFQLRLESFTLDIRRLQVFSQFFHFLCLLLYIWRRLLWLWRRLLGSRCCRYLLLQLLNLLDLLLQLFVHRLWDWRKIFDI